MYLNKLNVIWRNIVTDKNVILTPTPIQKCFLVRKSTDKNENFNSSSSSSSDSDDDVKIKKKTILTKTVPPKNNEETMTKLNSLLQQLIKNDTVAKSSELKLARPKDKRIPKEQRDARKVETNEKKIIKAVGEAAKYMGGDTKQTESELLTKLLSPVESKESSKSLNEIMKDMKIDREPKSVQKSKAEQVRNILQNVQTKRQDHVRAPQQRERRQMPQHRPRPPTTLVEKKINLFGAKPLGIFTNKDLTETNLKTWQKLYEKELKLAITHPPANYFQEMILWTEQGKLWNFPIDNEQGLEAEKDIDFSKHIFLDEHLDPWCPPKGPVRHFMELVCVGLSKNPYLTVEAKIEHIGWFKNYFEEKRKLLQEVGAFPIDEGNIDKTKHIE